MPGSEHAVQKALQEGRYGASSGWIDEDQMISLAGKRVALGVRQAVAAWMVVNDENVHGVLGISSSAEAVSVVSDMPAVCVRKAMPVAIFFCPLGKKDQAEDESCTQ